MRLGRRLLRRGTNILTPIENPRSNFAGRLARGCAAAACAGVALLLAGCSTFGVRNAPINSELTDSPALAATAGDPLAQDTAETAIGLSFSGGGTRASAFAFGVLAGAGENRRSLARRSASPAHRPGLACVRGLGRIGHGRLFRIVRARDARRFPQTVPDPGCRGVAQHIGECHEPDADGERRRERSQRPANMAR